MRQKLDESYKPKESKKTDWKGTLTLFSLSSMRTNTITNEMSESLLAMDKTAVIFGTVHLFHSNFSRTTHEVLNMRIEYQCHAIEKFILDI